MTKHQENCPTPVDAVPIVTLPAAVTSVSDSPIAYDMLEKNLGKDASLDVLRVFLGSIAELVVELQTAIRIRSFKEASVALHELESSCRVVGAIAISEKCTAMENHLQNTEWQLLESSMNELIHETRIVGQFINELLSQALRGHFVGK